ncbi:MAG: GNAT family N-acetyltransferase [Legionella sp.]|nr:GNAT family N-acetyltransferase [Legionella sp.]
MMPNIRMATQEDAFYLKQLLAQMGEIYERDIEEMENRIQSFLNLTRHQLLVAEDEEGVVGCIAFGCYEQLRLQGCCCHIDTLIVDKKYHGKGIGKALIATAEAYAKTQGATEIELTTANHRRKHGTHNFYKAIGYQDHVDIDCTYFVKQER